MNSGSDEDEGEHGYKDGDAEDQKEKKLSPNKNEDVIFFSKTHP